MTLTEQPLSSLASIASINQSPGTEAHDVAHSSNPQVDDMHAQYNTSTSTKMTTSRTYSPVPGAHDHGALYSPSSYNQHNAGMHHHHQTALLSSPPPPPFLHSTTGSPSPSTTTSSYSNHYQHYTSNSNFALAPLMTQTQQLPSHHAMRTVYLGNLAPDTSISDILDQVRSGILESARLLPDKRCVFITFIDSGAAAHFYHQVSHRPLTLDGMELKVGWGKPSELAANLQLALLQNGASRNVFLGSLDDTITEDRIRDDLKRFGTIEHVRLIVEKKIAFVHFLSIAEAIKCVNQLPNQVEWQNHRIAYGRDRCCPNKTTVNTNATNVLSASPSSPYHPHYYSPHPYHPIPVQPHAYQLRYPASFAYDPYTGTTIESYPSTTSPPQVHHHHHHHHQPSTAAHVLLPSALAPALATSIHGDLATPSAATTAIYQHHPYSTADLTVNALEGVANRTVYLGNIHPETTCEDICNVVRGGILSQIRYLVDKHIAFLVFVDPAQALQFYTQASSQGMVLKSRRLKLGWGKPSSLPVNVIQAVQSGGSRNVYLGNMDDTVDEEKLRRDFSEYGDIELVNTLKEKNCAFINFTSIAAALRAMEGIRTMEEYKRFRINYGKDRCGNPPRALAVPLQKKTSNQQQQQPMESTTTTVSSSSSSSSSSTTNSVTTPPTSSSNIAHTASPPVAGTTSNQEGIAPFVNTAAAPTLVNGLGMLPSTFTSSNNDYNVAPLTDLMADMVTDVALN